jgi:hypothetical protein
MDSNGTYTLPPGPLRSCLGGPTMPIRAKFRPAHHDEQAANARAVHLAGHAGQHHRPAISPPTNLYTPSQPPYLPPPPAPPPPTYSIPHTDCPPGCLLEELTRVPSPTTTAVDLQTAPTLDILLATLPEPPNSVTHIVCSPCVCGVHSDIKLSITISHDTSLVNRMVDGDSNICVTGNLGSLLNVVDIESITILVALEGTPATYNDCITKRGLLPLSLSDGSLYYQPCFYCTNMVKTIISLAAVLASSDIFFSWSQEGFKDPTLPSSLQFTSHDGLLSMFFPLQCQDSLILLQHRCLYG